MTPVAQFADGSFIYSNAVAADCVTPEWWGTPLWRRRRARRDVPREDRRRHDDWQARVEVEFTNTAAKERVSVRTEAGRAVIT